MPLTRIAINNILRGSRRHRLRIFHFVRIAVFVFRYRYSETAFYTVEVELRKFPPAYVPVPHSPTRRSTMAGVC
jgi:hypothetical protein